MDGMKYRTGAGARISLFEPALGKGGEGRVLPVAGNALLAAKLFKTPTAERRSKLTVMLSHPVVDADGFLPVAWPRDFLFTDERQPRFVGYIMPKVEAARPVFAYYNPCVRRASCPGFDYHYLVRSAANLAAAVASAHGGGYVIGDLNESNVLVAKTSLVTLIDADSWQVVDAARGTTYHCLVSKSDFMPRELQGQDLGALDRKPWHDNFALAVLIFKLLSEGSHPFDGVFRGQDEPPSLEARIAAGNFTPRDRSGRWAPKPLGVPFESLHPSLQRLFIQAFEVGHRHPHLRPDALAWQRALADAESDLQVCTRTPSHWSWGADCTWCQRAAKLGGIDPFPSPGGNQQCQSAEPDRPKQGDGECQFSPGPGGLLAQRPGPLAKAIRTIAQTLGVPRAVVATLAVLVAILIAELILVLMLQLVAFIVKGHTQPVRSEHSSEFYPRYIHRGG